MRLPFRNGSFRRFLKRHWRTEVRTVKTRWRRGMLFLAMVRPVIVYGVGQCPVCQQDRTYRNAIIPYSPFLEQMRHQDMIVQQENDYKWKQPLPPSDNRMPIKCGIIDIFPELKNKRKQDCNRPYRDIQHTFITHAVTLRSYPQNIHSANLERNQDVNECKDDFSVKSKCRRLNATPHSVYPDFHQFR